MCLLSAASVFFAGKNGLIRPHASYGHAPKVALAAIFGYFAGKFSYVNQCADKFLTQLPDSNVADAIRKRRGMQPRERDQAEVLALQEQQEQVASMEADNRLANEKSQSSKGRTTYDELRRQHREQEQQQAGLLQQPSTGLLPGQQRTRQNPRQPSPQEEEDGADKDPMWAPPSKLRKKPTNKYGDEGFE